MNRFLLDINVVLDHLLERQPHAELAQDLWAMAARKEIEAYVPAHAVTTIFYLGQRARGATFARRVVGDLLTVLHVAPVDQAVLTRALSLPWADFEDAVCVVSAEAAGCGAFVTRDGKGFSDSPVPVLDPATAIALLEGGPGPDRVAEARSKRRSGGGPRSRRDR